MPVTNSRDVTADAPARRRPARHADRAVAQPRRHGARGPRSVSPSRRRALARPGARRHAHVPVSRMGVRPRWSMRPSAGVARSDTAGERAARDVRRVRALRRRLRGPRRRSERAARVLPRVGRARRPPVPRRAGRGARVRAAHRRELPRHGPLPVRSRRRPRRRVAHRGAGLHGDRQGGRHRGHQLPVLATGGDSGIDVRGRRRVPLPGAPPVRGHADQAPTRRRGRLLADDHGVTARRGALPDVDDRRLHRSRREHRGLPRLQPPDLRPGRADPRIATAAAAPARPDRRVGAEGRSRFVRLPPLARRPRAAVRHQSHERRNQ